LDNLVDLLPLTKKAMVLAEPSYSLKVVEQLAHFKRTQDEYGGKWAIAKYIEVSRN
jgi:predicted RecB family nuclease